MTPIQKYYRDLGREILRKGELAKSKALKGRSSLSCGVDLVSGVVTGERSEHGGKQSKDLKNIQ